MASTQPNRRMHSIETQFNRYRDDIEAWQADHDAPRDDCWFWEDLVKRSNALFARILDLDLAINEYQMEPGRDFDPRLDEWFDKILKVWQADSLALAAQVERIESLGDRVREAEQFRANVKQAQAMLTRDNEFFVGEKLEKLRDAAIEEHRAGLTESMCVHELPA